MTNAEKKMLEIELETLRIKNAMVKKAFSVECECPEMKRTFKYRTNPIPHPVVAGYPTYGKM